MHCACAKRLYFHFRSKIWRHHHVPRPRFPFRRENFRDSRTFKADIGLLDICIDFQDLLAQNGGFVGQNRGRGCAILTPNELTFCFWGFLRLCQFRWKSIKKCDRESARRRTDWQTQTGIVICPMLYALTRIQFVIHSIV